MTTAQGYLVFTVLVQKSSDGLVFNCFTPTSEQAADLLRANLKAYRQRHGMTQPVVVGNVGRQVEGKEEGKI